MKRPQAIKIISGFLRQNFNDFVIKKSLSDFAQTFFVVADKQEYVVKLIEYQNVVSKIKHNKKHIQNIIFLSNWFSEAIFYF